jgi:PAS domain S-box-containing protein
MFSLGILLFPTGPGPYVRYLACLVLAVVVLYLIGCLRQIETRWAATLRSIGDGVIVIDRNGCIRFLNPAAEEMTGWTLRESRARRLDEILKLEGGNDGNPIDPVVKSLLEEGKVFRAARPAQLTSRDGHQVWVEESGAPVRDRRERVIGAILLFRDVTARREMQNQMNQSQRMEAVGRLASGVAGDFNDLLTVMTGFSEMLRMDLEAGDHRRRFADEIYAAADRAATLTRQLTALGQKRPGPFKVLDMSAVILSMEMLLRRLLGPGIELIIVPGNGKVRADAAQLEQVVVNLAMNSRDAMPNGGKFVIEIASMDIDERQNSKWPGLKPGSYVALAVSDTGTGMDAETRAHLFEPFFTTKTRGKGTGLGLSIVYGIIQQSGGYISVYSQLGAGTIFEIFLPRHRGTAEIVLPPLPNRARRGTETILIAEDEDGVRKLVYSVLATNGYKVLEAQDGAEALAIYESNQSRISLVVTDVIMPNMSGDELGERLKLLNPGLRVLYMSGHQDHALDDSSTGAPAPSFLHKPFTPDVLLTKVRELLDRPEAIMRHNKP